MATTSSCTVAHCVILLCLGLLLSGCVSGGAGDAAWGKTYLIGKPLDYAEACIGIPNSKVDRLQGGQLVEWSSSEPAIPVSVPLPLVGNLPGLAAAVDLPMAAFTGAITTQLGGGNGRLMVVTDTGNIIREVHMAGPADGFSGQNSLIGTDLLRGCHRDATPLLVP